MKPWDLVDYAPEPWYTELRFERHCWACGRARSDWPEGWSAPFLIERAHIVSSPRREDRRAVIMLCTLCHKRQHGERIIGFEHVPQLGVPQMLWIKRDVDRGWYDVEFLARCSIGRLPEPERLGEWFLQERKRWR